MSRSHSIAVLQVCSPADIAIRETSGTNEFTDFDRLNHELATMFDSDTYIQHTLFDLTIGKKYVARVAKKNNQWCRVRVENTMEGSTNFKVICYLIDYGHEEILDRKCLRLVHQKYFDLPAQVKSVSLANVIPAALETDIETFNTELRPSDKWSPASTEHVKNRALGRMNVTVQYLPGSQHKVLMSVDGVCINDELVNKKLAIQRLPALPVRQKIRTFSESLEIERQIEEEERREEAERRADMAAVGVDSQLSGAPRSNGGHNSDSEVCHSSRSTFGGHIEGGDDPHLFAVYQHEMDLPLRLALDETITKSLKPVLPSPVNTQISMPHPVKSMGRGQRLLAAFEQQESAVSKPGHVYTLSSPTQQGDGIQAPTTIRLPRTQSIAQTCSPPRPTLTKEQVSPGRTSANHQTTSPRMALLAQLAAESDSMSQKGSVSSCHSSKSGSDVPTDSDLPTASAANPTNVYKKSRRPNLNQKSYSGHDVMPVNVTADSDLAVGGSGCESLQASSGADIATASLKNLLHIGDKPAGDVDKQYSHLNTSNNAVSESDIIGLQASSQFQDVRPKTRTILKTAAPDQSQAKLIQKNTRGMSTSYSSGEELTKAPKLRRGVSFSDTDEIKEFIKDSLLPATEAVEKLSMSSGGDSDDMSYSVSGANSSLRTRVDDDTARIYQRRLHERDYGEDKRSNEVQPTAIHFDQSKALALKKQATVFSDTPITPIFNIQKSKLHDRTLRHWRSLGGSNKQPLCKLQAYGWPALRRGMELVAITDPFIMEGRDGVSLTYIMAAATLMFDVDSYISLPRGGGPRCLILCASWSKAEQIYFHVSSIYGEENQRSLLVLHGRRDTESKLCCDLVNGTDVIVSTPCTFIRMLESGHTNVKRLCHLFIDDADVITKEFPKQLSGIMKEVGLAVSENVDRAAPRQIALFSSTWTPLIGRFRTEYMTASATIITNKIEASISCNVKQMLHYIGAEEHRLSTMLRLVRESGSPAMKLVVCTHTESDANKVYSALHAYSHEVYLAIRSSPELDQVMMEWERVRSENSYPILVITDEVLHILINEDNPVIDAKYVLHYNMPDNKKLLGIRLHCLSAHYAQDAEELMLSSHIIFTPNDHQKATTIVRIIDRVKCEVPDEVRQLSIRAIERNETGKKKELCQYMKSYGKCRDQLKCIGRHIVSAQLDMPAKSLPTAGDVEFKVISVRDAVTMYARITRHRDLNGVLHTKQSNKFQLDLALQTHFSQKHVKICLDPDTIERERLCVYEQDTVYYRVKIIEGLHEPGTSYPPTARVLLLDEGRIVKVKTRKLYELPAECSLYQFPLEIVEIRICKLKPEDHDVDWSSEANAYMSQLLQGELLSGKIQLCLGTTMWCEPIVKREYLKDMGRHVTLWSAHKKLLGDVSTGNLALKNPEHINILKKACEEKITLPTIPQPNRPSRADELVPQENTTPTDVDDIVIPTRVLSEAEPVSVYLSIVDTPDLLFLMRTDQHERLRAMEEELDKVMRRKGKLPLRNTTLRSPCVAKYPDEDNKYCRCVIFSHTAGKLLLLAADYGLTFETPFEEVSAPPPDMEDLRTLAYQAIECHLPTVTPSGAEWDDRSGDLIWDTLGQSFRVYAKVLTTKPAKFIGEISYGVDLIDCTEATDLSISTLLITETLAVERELDIQKRLGIDFATDQLDYPYQQIPKLIRLLNRTESHEKRVLICQHVRSLVYESSNMKAEMRREGIVKNLCTLVNEVNLHPDLLYHVLDSLLLMVTSSLENCEELWWEKGFSYLHTQLGICQDNVVLTKVLACLQHLIRYTSIQQEVDNLEDFIIKLIQIIRSSSIANNKVTAMDILNTYIQGNQKRTEHLVSQNIAQVLQDLLIINSDDVVQSTAGLINSIIVAEGAHDNIDAWTAILNRLTENMFKVGSDQGLCVCMKTVYTMLKNLKGATEMLKSTQLHEKITRLINAGLNATTREACLNVLIRVKPEVCEPQADPVKLTPRNSKKKENTQTIDLVPLPKGMPLLVPTASVPTVYWWEARRFLMLQVQVHNALQLDPPPQLHFKGGKLDFRCGNYQFKLGPLYDKIRASRSKRQIYASEIKYALYKETPGLWSKLLRPGHKRPSFVRPNMDLMVTSSEEESDSEDISPFDRKPKPYLRYSFDSIRGVPAPVSERPPPAEENITSASEASEEEDERFDTDYRSRYDYFNV